jgi:hypothetical protein
MSNRVGMGDVADVSEVHAASIFMVEVGKTDDSMFMHWILYTHRTTPT